MLVALAASVYLIYVLEILKFKSRRAIELRRADPATSEHEIDEQVAARRRDRRVRAGRLVAAATANLASPAFITPTARRSASSPADPRAPTAATRASPRRPSARRARPPSTITRARRRSTTSSRVRGGCASAPRGDPMSRRRLRRDRAGTLHTLWNDGRAARPAVLLRAAYCDDDTVMTGRS